jgi:two-component system OmpR family response regulator
VAEDNDRIAVVIEDDDDVRELIETLLIESGFEVKLAATGLEGVELIAEYQPAIVTLDMSMPGMDGLETLRRIRAGSPATPVIMISSHTDEIDVVAALSAGADDYISKPFRSRELRARIEAVLRRTQTPIVDAPSQPHLEFGALLLNPERRTARVGEVALALTRSEFDLLAELVANAGRVNTKSSLIYLLRGDVYDTQGITEADKRALEVHIANLRRKIETAALNTEFGYSHTIETVRGIGYRITQARGDDITPRLASAS